MLTERVADDVGPLARRRLAGSEAGGKLLDDVEQARDRALDRWRSSPGFESRQSLAVLDHRLVEFRFEVPDLRLKLDRHRFAAQRLMSDLSQIGPTASSAIGVGSCVRTRIVRSVDGLMPVISAISVSDTSGGIALDGGGQSLDRLADLVKLTPHAPQPGCCVHASSL